MRDRQGNRLPAAALIGVALALSACKPRGASDSEVLAAEFEAVTPTAEDQKLLGLEDDCTLIRKAIATRTSDSNLVDVENGTRDGQPHTFISIYPNSRPGSNGIYHCRGPIVLDQSHMTVRGAGNGIITVKLAPFSPAPLLILGSIDPPVYDEVSKGWDKIRKVKDVHAQGFFLDGNRVEQLHPEVHVKIAKEFVSDPELTKVFRFASEIVAQLSLQQAYKYPDVDQIDETIQPLRDVVSGPATAGNTERPPIKPDDFARFEANIFKVKNILRAARAKVSPQAEKRLPIIQLLPQNRLGKYVDLHDATKPNDEKLLAYLKDAQARLDKFIDFYRKTVNIYECWLLDKKPELGNLICDNNAWPTSHIRNNGVTIRGVLDGSVENVTAINSLSGGMVTEKNCERLFVDNFESTENYYDGFAGYKTKDSMFCRMNLHGNNNAAISIDQHFSHNTFEKSRFFQNGDVGIFARESEENTYKNVSIIGNRNHGVFLSEVDANGPESGARRYKFIDSCIAYSEGFGIRINDAGSGGAELRNVILHQNLMENLSLANGAVVEPKDTKADFDLKLCKSDEAAFKADYNTSCAKPTSNSSGE